MLIGWPELLVVVLPLVVLAWSLGAKPEFNAPRIEPVESPRRKRPHFESDSLVWLALSGGGTRAAALAWSVLQALDDVPFPTKPGDDRSTTTLADEIDVISGISGGSFAAVAWALRGQDIPDFRENFLQRNIERGLAARLFNPYQLLRLTSPHFDRINMASELYDETVFGGKTFDDLPSRPEVRLHATHLALGARFSFTEESFDLIGSDLQSYPLAYACAASSAFPVLLSPLTLLNHGETKTPEALALDKAYARAERNSRDDIEQYYETVRRDYYNEKSNRFIHLADGGLVDNQGLQAVLDELPANGMIRQRLNYGKVPLKRLIIINVNAGTMPEDTTGRTVESPRLGSVVTSTMVTSMDLLSAKRWVSIQENCRQLYEPVIDGQEGIAFAGMEEPFTIEVNFRNVGDPSIRDACFEIPTSFKLSARQRELIDTVGPELLHQDPNFQRLAGSLHDQFDAESEARQRIKAFLPA